MTTTFSPEQHPMLAAAAARASGFPAPPPRSFPTKLHVMLEDAERNSFQDIVTWQPGGKSFKVLQPTKFASSIMRSYFKQTKYKSFQRQLNIYGFQRIHYGPNKGGYSHPCFIRGLRELCPLIARQSIPPTTANGTAAAAAMNNKGATESSINNSANVFEDDKNSPLAVINETFSKNHSKNEYIYTATAEPSNNTVTGVPVTVSCYPANDNKIEVLKPDFVSTFFGYDHTSSRNGADEPVILLDGVQDKHASTGNSSGNNNNMLSMFMLPDEEQNEQSIQPINIMSIDDIADMDEILSLSGENADDLQQKQEDNQDNMQAPPVGSDHVFPWKLHKMLDDAERDNFEHIVSWVEDGAAFKVHKSDEFVDKIMPIYFDQTKYESFRRQLNLYGFARATRGENRGIYFHQFFLQSDRSLCQNITRPRSSSSSSPAKAASSSPVVKAHQANNGEIPTEIHLI